MAAASPTELVIGADTAVQMLRGAHHPVSSLAGPPLGGADLGLEGAALPHGLALDERDVLLGGRAAELLELGYAKVDPDRLPEGYEHYRELERRAKDRQVGLWASAV